jgi:hypothetical protein
MEPRDHKHLGPQLIKTFGVEAEPAMSMVVRICIVGAFGIILLAVAIMAIM